MIKKHNKYIMYPCKIQLQYQTIISVQMSKFKSVRILSYRNFVHKKYKANNRNGYLWFYKQQQEKLLTSKLI